MSMTLDAFLRRRRRRPWWVGLLVIAACVVLILADRQGLLLYDGDDLARYDGERFVVTRVVDGDTLLIAARDGDRSATRVRLWGIDTPELARPDLGRPAAPFAEEAKARAAALAEGITVRLILEPGRVRDRYDRLLAFVELPDGTLLNEQLLLEGLAEADDRWPHQYVERFELLEEQAQKSGAGMWAAPR